MRALDEVYTATPFYGSRRLQVALRRQGQSVNRKRVQRLMRLMGIEAVGPKPRSSPPHPGHRVYPYLLRAVSVERVDQVWSCDITYIRLRAGFVYLMAVLDWFSRYVLAWGTVGHSRRTVLSGRARGGAGDRAAGDFQYRPGRAVHQRRVHGPVADGRRADQHGRPRSDARQRLRRAALAVGEVRRGST